MIPNRIISNANMINILDLISFSDKSARWKASF